MVSLGLWERERAGTELLIRWIPSHLGVEGNLGADPLAEQGRQLLPDNTQPMPKRRRTQPQWEALALEEMSSDDGEVRDSGLSSDAVSSGAGDFSKGVSGTRPASSDSQSSGFSMDMSDSRRGECRRQGG